MSISPQSPRLLKGGIVLMEPESGDIRRVIALQYNPTSLTRTLQAQFYEPRQGAEQSERLRIKGPPVETFKLDAEIDATDALEHPDRNEDTMKFGIQPQLAALETLVYPDSDKLTKNNQLADGGTLEIVPMEALLTIFVWSASRIAPVRITEFSITEEFFDPNLNPIQAKVSLGLRVLTVDDLGFNHRGGQIYLNYQKQKELLRDKRLSRDLHPLGISEIRS